MAEDAVARVDQQEYLDARERQFDARCGESRSTLQIREVIERLLFHKLPAVAAELMQGRSGSEVQSNCPSDRIFFFNEHYVVKPPRSAVEFRWHQDDEEQLGMCVHRPSIPPYVSAWCALDEVTSSNGPLRFVSQSTLREATNSGGGDVGGTGATKLDAIASSPILASAGTAIFFLSDVWHCSSSNDSDAARRAFYAQYSPVRITASAADLWPLSFAIPCVIAEAKTSSSNERGPKTSPE